MLGEVGVEGFAAVHGAVVVGHDVFEGFETSVVHVGEGVSEVAKARC